MTGDEPNLTPDELREIALQLRNPFATLPDNWPQTVAHALDQAATIAEHHHPTL